MKYEVKVSTIYNCTFERSFKTPFLCDITKIHTGYGLNPKVTHCTEDENWGKPDFKKKVFINSSFMLKAGYAFDDKIIERVENKYWKIEVCNFQHWLFGFSKFVGKWQTKELRENEILIEYTYEMHSKSILFYPFHWLFTKIYWRLYMKNILKEIKIMIENKEAYLYK